MKKIILILILSVSVFAANYSIREQIARTSSNYAKYYRQYSVEQLKKAGAAATKEILATLEISNDSAQIGNLLEVLHSTTPENISPQPNYKVLLRFITSPNKDFADSAINILGRTHDTEVLFSLIDNANKHELAPTTMYYTISSIYRMNIGVDPNLIIPFLKKDITPAAKEVLLKIVLRNSGSSINDSNFNSLLMQLYSDDAGIPELIIRIASNPKQDKEKNIIAFYKKIKSGKIVPNEPTPALNRSKQGVVIEHLIHILEKINSKEARQFLHSVAESIYDVGRYDAVEALRELKDTTAIDLVIRGLRTPDPLAHATLKRYLTDTNIVCFSREKLIEQLNYAHEPKFQTALIDVLKYVGDTGVLFAVAPKLSSTITGVRAAAEVCIVDMKNMNIRDYIEGIKANDPYLRSLCMQALFKRHFARPQNKQDFILALNDNDRNARLYAAKILVQNYKVPFAEIEKFAKQEKDSQIKRILYSAPKGRTGVGP